MDKFESLFEDSDSESNAVVNDEKAGNFESLFENSDEDEILNDLKESVYSSTYNDLCDAINRNHDHDMVKYINLGANLLQLNAKEQYPLHLWLRMITNTEMKITKKHVGILKSFFPKGCENQLQIKLLNHSDLRGNSALSVSLTYDIWYQAVNRDYFTKKPDRYSFHGQYIELSPISKYLLQRGCKLKPNKGNMTVFHEFASIMFGDHIIPGFKVNDPDDLETINHIYLDVPLVLVILKTFKVIGKLDLNWRRDSDNFTGYDVIVDRYHSHNIDLNEIEYTRLIEGLGHLGCKSFKVQTSKKRSRRQFESQ